MTKGAWIPKKSVKSFSTYNLVFQFFKEIYDHLISSEGRGRKKTDLIPLEMIIVNTLGYLVYLNIFFAITFT